MGSILKGKNLLLEEQILSFKSRPLLKKKDKTIELLTPVSKPMYLNTVYQRCMYSAVLDLELIWCA